MFASFCIYIFLVWLRNEFKVPIINYIYFATFALETFKLVLLLLSKDLVENICAKIFKFIVYEIFSHSFVAVWALIISAIFVCFSYFILQTILMTSLVAARIKACSFFLIIIHRNEFPAHKAALILLWLLTFCFWFHFWRDITSIFHSTWRKTSILLFKIL